jgi:hypothetical protein
LEKSGEKVPNIGNCGVAFGNEEDFLSGGIQIPIGGRLFGRGGELLRRKLRQLLGKRLQVEIHQLGLMVFRFF